MYSLIVTGYEGAWDGAPYKLELDRVGEYTDEPIAIRYKEFDTAAINGLQSLPTLFAYEQRLNASARLGSVKRLTTRLGQVRIEYEFQVELPPIPAERLAALEW